jgi:hypothetical protein
MMAREAAEVWGRRECWRAGFARGVSEALDDPRLGEWDRQNGMKSGRSDPRVRALGDHFAKEAADAPAAMDAEARVRAQFMDLARQPGRDRAGGEIPRGTEAQFDGPFAAEPVLEDVFDAYPFARDPGLSRDGRRAIEGWGMEPTNFAHRDRVQPAYDARWKDPGAAFSTWRGRQGPRSPWSRLTAAEWDRFRAIFCNQFDATLDSLDLRYTRDAWRAGFEDGWRYGARIQSEWSFRRGYAQGFDAGIRETASIAYPYAFARAYDDAYDHWFNEWSRTAHPGIGSVQLADESGDGIYEPGERVLIKVDLVNYGGGDGSFDLIASGSELGAPSSQAVRLSGRGRAAGAERLALRVNDRVPPRTRTAVTVTLADARADTPLYVSRPFELEDSPAIKADRLEGRVTLDFAVSNTSNRDAHAMLRVEPLTGPRDPRENDLGIIPAGGRRTATVAFDGIHPLDLIGGESRWRASVARGDVVDDTQDIRIAPVATDLSNPDLMDFMVALARTAEISRSDVKDARALMMERLRADWARAAGASGNPYKRDFDTEGTETVLGQLVRVAQGGKRSFASPQVFAGLDDDIMTLAEDLPGAHPLLRKWMKKLASRVG